MLLPHLNIPVTYITLIRSKLDSWILRLNIILPFSFMALLTPNCPSFLLLFPYRSISRERKGRLVALLKRKLWESLSELDRCLKQVIQRFRNDVPMGRKRKYKAWEVFPSAWQGQDCWWLCSLVCVQCMERSLAYIGNLVFIWKANFVFFVSLNLCFMLLYCFSIICFKW